ncbi:MAG: hypothetical protein SPI03_07940 [Campylobacter sputorum]|uniref:c-type cytochrome n=1 Tax=Campylobacter sputorum TaxID=206 RepID=UPI000B771AC7|nr:hypothetical protein [Campylobacter sputorum]ASM38096.1 monoheme c-type cytochrome [Campylobacter sputorum bv. paraureolyticus LMG 11764]MDY6121244.1 hypothetical protein [Campylobacter sputorum]
MKKISMICVAVFFLIACQKSEDKNRMDQNISNLSAQNTIVIKKGDQNITKDMDQFINYDIKGQRQVSFTINNENNETTKDIVAHSNIRNPYKKINLSLVKKTLGRNFILKCSACHNDYANGVIGPSLLDKTSNEIYTMIIKYKNTPGANVLMSELVNRMPEDEIKGIANEIYEFNKQFGEIK